MSFTSLTFLFFFFPISIIISTIAPKKFKNVILLMLSLYFYSWGKPSYLILILLSIIFTYYGVRFMRNIKEDEEKKFCMVCLVVVNIAILGFFKYYGFLIDNINLIPGLNLKIINIPLPFGISFYTFKMISYIVDIYKGKVKRTGSLIDCALYICIFPQIGAGPIVRYVDMYKELSAREVSIEKIGNGLEKFIIGLGKKVLIANNLALIWSQVKSTPNLEISSLTAWIGIIAFTLQIYFDFSGYSDMAIGIGRMLGFNWAENFNYPYIARSATEFWRRWHISLGNWFKHYIYFPLGGNKTSHTSRNIFVVWLVTGLWHGASWNFIFWGLYYGVLVSLEKGAWGEFWERKPDKVRLIYSLLVVVIGWVMFELYSVSDIFKFYKTMFFGGTLGVIDPRGKYLLRCFWKLIFIAILGSSEYGKNRIEDIKLKYGKSGYIFMSIVYVVIFILSVASLVGSSYSPFLYFQF